MSPVEAEADCVRAVEEVAVEMLEAEADKEVAKAAKAKTRRKAPAKPSGAE